MLGIMRFFLERRLKRIKQAQATGGFTMIELLVALVIAVIIVGSLLGFVVDILNADRREQAKSNSEQEIQAALDYIARDLEQAIFIYDADGIYGRPATSTAAALTGLRNAPAPGALPPETTADGKQRIPVLVFWKRQFLSQDQTIGGRRIGNLFFLPPPTPGNTPTNQDYQVYSLVAYYQTRDSACNPNSIWSCTTRIERFEIRDGIRVDGAGGIRNTNYPLVTRTEPAIPTSITTNYVLPPSSGYMPFTLSAAGDTLKEKLDKWRKHDSEVFQPEQFNTLIDYVDQTPFVAGSPSPPAPQTCGANEQRVPKYDASPALQFQAASFYACIRTDDTVNRRGNNRIARIFIRGNALARISPKDRPPEYSDRNSAYFPTLSIQVETRGNLTSIQ